MLQFRKKDDVMLWTVDPKRIVAVRVTVPSGSRRRGRQVMPDTDGIASDRLAGIASVHLKHDPVFFKKRLAALGDLSTSWTSPLVGVVKAIGP